MTQTAYQYLSDDGNTYQVVLPSDFAASLGYAAATGSEVYLPEWISYRYCTYQSIDGLSLNSVCVTTPFAFAQPPQLVTVSGITYFLKSSYGEQRGVPSIPGLLTIAGPQGPPGAAGPPGPGGGFFASVHVTSAQMLALHTTAILIAPAPGAGKTINPYSGALRCSAGTPYDGGSNFQFNWGDPYVDGNRFNFAYTVGLVNSAQVGTFYNETDAEPFAENLPIYIWCQDGNPTTGTMSVDFFLWYNIF